jgi:thioredoxin 1
LANDNAGIAKVVKVDISDNYGLAERYGIQYLPTLIVFKNGQPIETQVGLHGPEKLQAMINSAL